MIFRRSKSFFHQKGYIPEKALSRGKGTLFVPVMELVPNRRNLFSGHQVISNLTLVFTVVLKREKI